jgi:hypothetical protein
MTISKCVELLVNNKLEMIEVLFLNSACLSDKNYDIVTMPGDGDRI